MGKFASCADASVAGRGKYLFPRIGGRRGGGEVGLCGEGPIKSGGKKLNSLTPVVWPSFD